MNSITHITMDDAHDFAGALIAHGWRNNDPDCVDQLYRQLVAFTEIPDGYQLAPIEATPEMERAGQATGVNAAWSYAKCYRSMLDAQPGNLALTATAGKPIGYMPKWAASHMSDQGGVRGGWGVTTHIYREPMDGYVAVYLVPPAAGAPSDPLDMILPCDITIGAGTIRKGCKLRTLVTRAESLHRALMMYMPKPTAEQVAAFDHLARIAAKTGGV